MRKFLVSALAAGCLLGTAATAEAVPAPAIVRTHVVAAAPAAQGAPAAASIQQARHATTTLDTRSRNRTRKKRSGLSRFFGALAFLFIGLPLLIIAALVLFFLMRRARKQNEAARYDATMQNQYGQSQQPPYPGDRR